MAKEFKRTYKFAAYTSSFLTFFLTLVVGVFFYVTKIEMYWFILLFAIVCFSFSFLLARRDGVVTARVTGMAFTDSLGGKKNSTDCTVFFNSLTGVM